MQANLQDAFDDQHWPIIFNENYFRTTFESDIIHSFPDSISKGAGKSLFPFLQIKGCVCFEN